MLENLFSTDWSKLSHAYGSATDVPNQLLDLASSDKDKRRKAIWDLYGNVIHQGTHYEATAYVVPFLFELLRNNTVSDKEKIIYLLISLATGEEPECLPFDFNPLKVFKEAEGIEFSPDFERVYNLLKNDPQYFENATNIKFVFEGDTMIDFYEESSLPDVEINILRRLTVFWHRKTYDAVAKQAKEFLELVNSSNEKTRKAAIYATTWFPAIAD